MCQGVKSSSPSTLQCIDVVLWAGVSVWRTFTFVQDTLKGCGRVLYYLADMHMALRLSVHKGKLIVILINDNIYHLSHDLSPVHKLMPITYITSKTLCTTLSEFKR